MRRRMRVALLVTTLALAACATAPPPPAVPEWSAVPASVVDALCRRLQMDALATGRLTIVRTTQPLVTQRSVAALAGIGRKGRPKTSPSFANRSMPVELSRGNCAWNPIAARDSSVPRDEMVIEMSSPIANPWVEREAGLFARASLGDGHASWYWISLAPRGDDWSVKYVSVLLQ